MSNPGSSRFMVAMGTEPVVAPLPVRGKRRPPPPPPEGALWFSLAHAARLLSQTPTALRRALERRAVRAPDGGIEANVDGVRGRKLGRLWRVRLDPRWLDVVPPNERTRGRGTRTGVRP